MRTPKRQIKMAIPEVHKRICDFHNVIRSRSQLFGPFSLIANVDETPMSFSGGPLEKVVCKIGEGDCIVRADSSNTKRNATLVMTVASNGKGMGILIFKSDSEGSRIPQSEVAQYDKRVKVFWQPKAVIDGQRWHQYLDDWSTFKIAQV